MTHLDEVLSAYLDGEVSGPEVSVVHSHLAECPACRAQLAELYTARRAVRSLPVLDPPTALVAARVGRRRRAPVWAGAAAAVAAAVVALVVALQPASEPVMLSELSLQVGARASLDPGLAPVKLVVPQPDKAE